MAPRRGGGSGGFSSSFDDSSPWAQEIQFTMDSRYISRDLFIAAFAFDILFALALIGFLTWSCLIRNHNGQMKGVVVTLVSWLCCQICSIVYQILTLAEATVTYYINVDLMLEVFFLDLAIVMVVFVFYNLIHRLLNRLTDSGKPYAAIAIVHWVVFSILAVVSLASWILYVVYLVKSVQGPTSDLDHFSDITNKLDSARVILFFIVSVEIFAWVLFAAIKAGSHRFVSRSPIYSVIAGSICWWAFCLSNAIIYIRYYLNPISTDDYPQYVPAARSILQFFFGVGTLVGILLGCQKWRYVDDSMDKPPVTVQYPYGGVPYQPQPGYQQQFQPYPGPQPQYPQPQPYQQQPSPQPHQ